MLKLFSKNQRLESTFDQKVFCNSIYSKYLVRYKDNRQVKPLLVDNFSEYLSLGLKMSPESIDQGESLIMKNIMFKHVQNKEVSFEYLGKNSSSKSLSHLFKALTALRKRKNDKMITFLEPNKGGFFCYSNGITGFLPKSQGLLFLNKINLKFRNCSDVNKDSNRLSFLLSNKHVFKDLVRITFPGIISKVTIQSQYYKNNFSRTENNFRFSSSNNLNFVFISNLIKKRKRKKR